MVSFFSLWAPGFAHVFSLGMLVNVVVWMVDNDGRSGGANQVRSPHHPLASCLISRSPLLSSLYAIASRTWPYT